MVPDGGGGAHERDIPLLTTDRLTVDVDEVRQVANRVLGIADRTEAVASRRTMHEASSFGMPLAAAATQWADRYAHLLDGVAAEVEHAGYALRSTADVFHEVEISARRRLSEDAGATDLPW